MLDQFKSNSICGRILPISPYSLIFFSIIQNFGVLAIRKKTQIYSNDFDEILVKCEDLTCTRLLNRK